MILFILRFKSGFYGFGDLGDIKLGYFAVTLDDLIHIYPPFL